MLVRVLGAMDTRGPGNCRSGSWRGGCGGKSQTPFCSPSIPRSTRAGASSKAPRAGIPCLSAAPRSSGEADITYHGPGQLVGYPIVHLGERGLRPRGYLRTLEGILIEAVRPLGVEAQSLKGFTGVWARGRKLASIGVAVRGQVSYHGFALNVDCDLEGFRAIHPCNLEPEQMTSLQSLLGRPVEQALVLRLVAGTFLSCFLPAGTGPRGGTSGRKAGSVILVRHDENKARAGILPPAGLGGPAAAASASDPLFGEPSPRPIAGEADRRRDDEGRAARLPASWRASPTASTTSCNHS